VPKPYHFLRLLLAAILIAGGFDVRSADVQTGLGHYMTHLRAGGEREPPAPVLRAGGAHRPVPTNQWYSSLLFGPWPQPLYAQPASYRPSAGGFQIDIPKKEAMFNAAHDDNDIVAMHRSSLVVMPEFAMTSAHAGKTSDWAVDVVTGGGSDSMTVTIAHGSPYSFHRLTRGDVSFAGDQGLELFHRASDGRAVGVVAGGRPFAIYAPAGSRWESAPDGRLKLQLPLGKRFFTVAALPGRDPVALAALQRHAYAFVTDTHVEWAYDEKRSEVTTTFRADTELMEGTESATVLGLYPHQWHRNPLLPAVLPNRFDTIRGPLMLVAANRFQTRYRYSGVMPFWPGLADTAAAAKLNEFIAADTQFGADSLLGNRGTCWEGKGLNRAAQVMSIAEQQGDLTRRDAILAAMKKRVELWFKPEPNAERYFHYNKSS